MSGLEPSELGSLRDAIGGDDRLLPFAAAVVRHLAGPGDGNGGRGAGTGELISRVGRTIRHSIAAGGEPPAELVEDPALLASFFQNADLLDPDSRVSASIAGSVMAAIGALYEASE